MGIVLSTKAYVLMSSNDAWHGGEEVIAVYESFDDAKDAKEKFQGEEKPCQCGDKKAYFIHHSRYIKESSNE
jgi:hypothetical protein